MRIRSLLLPALFGTVVALAPGRAAAPDAELRDPRWLTEVLVYSYYWYLNDAFFAAIHEKEDLEFWLRTTEPARRDAEDRSRFAELWIPDAHLLLFLKKADYPIPELDVVVKNQRFRVIRGAFESDPPSPRSDWTVVTLRQADVVHAFDQARTHLHAPEPAIRQLATTVLRRELARQPDVSGPQTFYLASRTVVAHHIWAYWIERRTIIQIAGDMDATSPAVMDHLPLMVRRYDLRKDVVASPVEAKGGNASLSHDFASRVLFICLARGEPVILTP